MPRSNRPVERAKTYLDNHLTDVERPRDVAEALEVSYETLRKRFRWAEDVPLGRYITQARVDEARRLLVETDEPVYLVCREVGFSSASSGIRTFKRCTGLTMGQYRRRYRGGSDCG